MYANIIAAEGNSTFTVCETETLITSNNITPLGCRGILAMVDPKVYVNSMVIGAATFSMFWIAIFIVKYLDKTRIYIIFSILSGCCIAIFPWTNGISTLTLSAGYIAIMNINMTLVISITVSAVPTVLRGMAVNMVMMFGRIGVIIGNLFIPIISEISCELSFFSLAQFHFACLIIIIMLMRIKKKSPES